MYSQSPLISSPDLRGVSRVLQWRHRCNDDLDDHYHDNKVDLKTRKHDCDQQIVPVTCLRNPRWLVFAMNHNVKPRLHEQFLWWQFLRDNSYVTILMWQFLCGNSYVTILMWQFLCDNYLFVKMRKIGQFLCDKYICWKANLLAFKWQTKVVTYEKLLV